MRLPWSLVGVAAALRLARLGHEVTLAGEPSWAWLDALPPEFTLIATWRDLFRKSGRPLDKELARQGISLVAAPPVLHRFQDGTSFELPSERGAAFQAIESAFHTPVAERWRDLIDRLDTLWRCARMAGVEAPRGKKSRALKTSLLATTTLADLADHIGEPHLAQIVLSVGPQAGTSSTKAPALLATRLSIERTFGRWRLERDAHVLPASSLADVFADRLATRKIRRDASLQPTIDIASRTMPSWRRARRALAPTITYSTHEPGRQVVEHTDRGPIVSWGSIVHDYSNPSPEPAWGYAPDSWAAWWRIPDAFAAGNEPWAQLSQAALAVYEIHERATGANVRPSNRSYRP